MLVLSRKVGESVMVGTGPDAVKVVVVELRGDKCRIGFECPKEIPVHRTEVYEVIHGKAPDKPDGISWADWNQLDAKGKADLVARKK